MLKYKPLLVSGAEQCLVFALVLKQFLRYTDNILCVAEQSESADKMCAHVTAAKSLLRKRLCTHELPPAIHGYQSEIRYVSVNF